MAAKKTVKKVKWESVRVSSSLMKKLREHTEKTRIPMSAIVDIAVKHYFETYTA